MTSFKRIVLTVIACIAVVAAAACTPTPEEAAAQKQASEAKLYATAKAENWGPAEWTRFAVFAQQQAELEAFYALVLRAEQCDRDALVDFIYLTWGSDGDYLINVIIPRESGWQCGAKNPRSTASGLTQQLNIHGWRYARRGWDWDADRFNGPRNIEIARELFNESGWRPWACC